MNILQMAAGVATRGIPAKQAQATEAHRPCLRASLSGLKGQRQEFGFVNGQWTHRSIESSLSSRFFFVFLLFTFLQDQPVADSQVNDLEVRATLCQAERT